MQEYRSGLPFPSPMHKSESEVTQSYPTVCYPWTVAHQASPSMGFSRKEYRSGLPFPSPGDLLNPGIEARSPTLQADALTSHCGLNLPFPVIGICVSFVHFGCSFFEYMWTKIFSNFVLCLFTSWYLWLSKSFKNIVVCIKLYLVRNSSLFQVQNGSFLGGSQGKFTGTDTQGTGETGINCP